jgi:ferrous iron transport protein A
MQLSEAGQGELVWVECLPNHAGLRERLLAMGIRPGVQLQVLRRGHPGGILHLADGSFEFMLRREHAAAILVRTQASRDPAQPMGDAALGRSE